MAIQRRISRMPPDEKVCVEVGKPLTGDTATQDNIEQPDEIVDLATESHYADDPIRQAHIAETDNQIAEVMEQIQMLAQRRYMLDKQINRLSIKLNHLNRVKVNLDLPFYEHK
jgi:hypothetical protein